MQIFRLSMLLCASPALCGEAKVNGLTFEVAEGFSLSLAAPPALVERPIEADFDDSGALYVSNSSGSNEPVQQQLEKLPHSILKLRDTDGDGVFDHRTVFADKLMFPEGVLWHGGSLYVAAPPQIWKLTDADGDGTADRREVWHDGKTLTGCANDVHGPYLGPDGFIYWCKGAFAEQTYDLPGRPGWKSKASHVFRCRPDKSEFDCVFTAGMDNPVGLTWTPEGDLIVSGTFFQFPSDGKRDGLIHAVRGGVWGKDHDVLTGHPRTGSLMPPMTHLGPAAPCGLCRYGPDLLLCQFNMHLVSRHHLIPAGASFRTEDSMLLRSEHPDFHPTDVLQAPDGSVLVIDTGGWYKLCCPTSQLAKPEVLGAIYRLRRSGGETTVPPPPPRIAPQRASNLLALFDQLFAPDLHIRRRAAELLGQWPKCHPEKPEAAREIVAPLMKALTQPDLDRFLEHAVTFALMEGADPSRVREFLFSDSSNPRQRQAAIYALTPQGVNSHDQDKLAPLLGIDDPGLRAALVHCYQRHGDCISTAQAWILQALKSSPPQIGNSVLSSLAQSMPTILPDLGQLLASSQDPSLRRALLQAMQHVVGQGSCPVAWTQQLLLALASDQADEAKLAAEIFGKCELTKQEEAQAALSQLVRSEKLPPQLRLLVLANPKNAVRDDAVSAFVLTQLWPSGSSENRLLAAQILGRSQLSETHLETVLKLLPSAGLLERPHLLKAFRFASQESLGLALIDALEKSHLLESLPEGLINDCLANYPDAVKRRAAQALQRSQGSREEQSKQLDALEKALPGGDIQRGSIIFQSAKATCMLCHQIGYKGGHLGPDLSAVGAIRTERDLLEAIVFPSASFVRSYEPVSVVKTDGSTAVGIIRNQGGSSIALSVGASASDLTLDLSEIKSMTPSQVSLMPAGFGQILSTQELVDLVVFLKSRR